MLVDLSQVKDMKYIIEVGDRIKIGAGTTFAQIASSPLLHAKATCLAEAASQIGSVQIRNRATIGGNIASASPAADGKSSKIAAEMAVDKINAEGGLLGEQVELVIYDDQAKADQAVPIANKLIGQDKVKMAVSGSYSGPTRAAATIFRMPESPTFRPMRYTRISQEPVTMFSVASIWVPHREEQRQISSAAFWA
jgi:ABC-type branched-subunit amino acid transport system substrate-binding protein